MLESFQKGYKKGIFSEEYSCPVKLVAIETYMQILLPAFQFNLAMQYSTYSICEVLPYLHIIMSKWERMTVKSQYQPLCRNLIKAFKHKFDYEINSSVYHVAALFQVSKLKQWFNRADCADLRLKAIKEHTSVAMHFLKSSLETPESSNRDNEASSSQSSRESNIGFIDDCEYTNQHEIGDLIIYLLYLKLGKNIN